METTTCTWTRINNEINEINRAAEKAALESAACAEDRRAARADDAGLGDGPLAEHARECAADARRRAAQLRAVRP